MKKNLLSLFILSSVSLSNQAIAEEYSMHENQVISIEGNVVRTIPTCTIDYLDTINLEEININDIDGSLSKEISIKFSECEQPDTFTQIAISLNELDTPDLKNTIENGSNVSIQLVDKYDRPISLNNQEHLKMTNSISEGSTEFKFYARYKKPENEKIRAGKVATSLTFDTYINDNIKYVDF